MEQREFPQDQSLLGDVPPAMHSRSSWWILTGGIVLLVMITFFMKPRNELREIAVPRTAIMIQTSPEYFKSRVVQIRETWGAHVRAKDSMQLMFVTGNVTDGIDDMYASDCDNGYLSGVCRLAFSIDLAYAKLRFDPEWISMEWILFADDDVYVLPDNLQRMILKSGLDPNNSPGVLCVPECIIERCRGFCGGGGIIMSRHTITRIVEERDANRFKTLREEMEANEPICGRYHDVSVGFFLEHNRTDIKLIPYPFQPYIFNFHDVLEFINSIRMNKGTTWLYHYASRDAMYWLHSTVLNLGTNVEISNQDF
jgi:hypothetical protein